MQAARKTTASRGALRLCSLLLATMLSAGSLAPATALSVAAGAPANFMTVTVDPAETSVYVAKIRLAMSPFTRGGAAYDSDYSVKVFPFFFFNERGRISIEFSDAQLKQLERGESVDIKGRACNSSGAERQITGRAVPAAPGNDHGKIKVRVWVSKNIELIFNTAYRFGGKE